MRWSDLGAVGPVFFLGSWIGLFATPLDAPLIAECYANLECKLTDAKLVDRYNFFIFEVVKAHAAKSPKYPKTLHYYGEGMFMVSGKTVNLRRGFRSGML